MPETTGEVQAERDSRGRFQRGRSGNPRGRPRGSRNKTAAFCQALLDESAGDVIERLVRMARDGDGLALRLVVERLVPRARPEAAVKIELPELQKAGDIVAAWATVIESAAAGKLSLEEAAKFGSILEGQRKALETAELAVRIEALERLGERAA